jgi:hypothetical protein
MGSRTNKQPTSEDTFLWRICHALDEPPRMLAANLGIDYREVEPLLDDKYLLVELDRDEVWWAISEYVSKRLGMIMAIQLELQTQLQKERTKRVMRVERFRKR